MVELRRQVTGTFVCDRDVHGRYPDGRRYLVARAGQTIPMTTAIQHGLVDAPKPIGPSSVKSDATAVNATNGAKELAEEHGVDLATVAGTGENGRILKSDVEAVVNG